MLGRVSVKRTGALIGPNPVIQLGAGGTAVVKDPDGAIVWSVDTGGNTKRRGGDSKIT